MKIFGQWATSPELSTCPIRLLSSYKLRNGAKLWVRTESDRSSTTLLPLKNTERIATDCEPS
jgi:hypothetical protein